MRVIFRADASLQLGTGHIMRCLTLADALVLQGGYAHFICREIEGHLCDLILEKGHKVTAISAKIDSQRDAAETAALALQTGANRVIVDHYNLDAEWEAVQPVPVMVIDDFTCRPHRCDILLNQNTGIESTHYDGLVHPKTTLLTGSRFALLRDEFYENRATSINHRTARQKTQPEAPLKVLISLGGTDLPNATARILHILSTIPSAGKLELKVILGSTTPHAESVRTAAAELPSSVVQVIIGTTRMAELMAEADIAIGAAGSTSWERCCVGLPTIMIVLAENQRPIADAIETAGAGLQVTLKRLEMLKGALGTVKENLLDMQHNAALLCDGRGTKRVVDMLLCPKLRTRS